MRVRVVGAGVIGLSCAVRLREAGLDAHVVAAEQGARTTSAVAAALWYPYHVGPRERVRAWGRATFAELRRLADDPATGVLLRPGVQYLRAPVAPPDWAADVPGFRALTAGALATDARATDATATDATADAVGGPYVGGWGFDAPVADTTHYLGWLTARLGALGGTVTTGHVRSVEEALAGVDRAVLATGTGAHALPGDGAIGGGRGQIVLVRAPRLRRWVLDDDHPDGMVYVVPRRQDVVCGGVDDAVPAATTAGPPDPAVAEAILRRCAEVVPELDGAEVLDHRVGVRPVRAEVRLELDGGVVHCYGHGGAGFTLSWGCADDVRDLLTGV
jgi:D-amino-acid oxidase